MPVGETGIIGEPKEMAVSGFLKHYKLSIK
jgi:hypothetical protein